MMTDTFSPLLAASSARALVSVIIPVYNGEYFLGEAVKSVLAQKHRPLEIIVVDDGSTDGTARVAACLGDHVRYIHQSNRGPASARNTGLQNARGSFVAFLDADDLWSEDKLTLQLGLLDRDPDAGFALGYTQIRVVRLTEAGEAVYVDSGAAWPALSMGGTLIRRETFDRVGMFDEEQAFAEDVEWLLRARDRGVPVTRHDDVIQIYRKHGGNMTGRVEEGHGYFVRAVKRSLERRGHGAAPIPHGWDTFVSAAGTMFKGHRSDA
jgi:glycosyltransferase involved in cell wall biosynthesis